MSFATFLKPKIKKLLKHPLSIKAISLFMFMYAQFVGITTKWEIRKDINNNENVPQPSILVGWHSRAVMLPFFWHKLTDKKLYALVSPHQDGQLIANFLKFYDIDPISGSTNEQSVHGALEIMRLLENKQNIFISPDGPRGPRMRMKKSPVYFASKTGFPIVFACYSTSKAFLIEKAWDKTMVALPFGKGVFTLSQPFYVPADINDEQLEEYRLSLENIANEITNTCDTETGRPLVEPADCDEIKKKRF